jgi:hypothetical protein
MSSTCAASIFKRGEAVRAASLAWILLKLRLKQGGAHAGKRLLLAAEDAGLDLSLAASFKFLHFASIAYAF